MLNIAIIDDYQNAALRSADWSAVMEHAKITVFMDHLSDPEALISRLQPFDAICVMRERTPFPASILERLPRLKFIGSNGASNATIDMPTANRLGIQVGSTGGRGNGAAELTWALILAAARHIPAESRALRDGAWQQSIGLDLEGHTLGILGLGKLGMRVAHIGQAFGMRVIAWSENLSAQTAAAASVIRVDKPTLLKESDWLSLHLVLSERTKGLIGADELALMKPSAWLVNTSRGALVNEHALIEALHNKAIAGAALDVFDQEPLPAGHPFRTLDNVVATPHIGFVTEGTYQVFYEETVQNLLTWIGPTRTPLET